MSHSVASPVNGYYGRYQAEVKKSYVGAAPERPHGAGVFDRAARPDGAAANSAAPHAQASFSAITDMLRELNNMITTLSARMGGQQHRTLPATKLILDQTRSVLQPHSPPLERSALGVDSHSDVPEFLQDCEVFFPFLKKIPVPFSLKDPRAQEQYPLKQISLLL